LTIADKANASSLRPLDKVFIATRTSSLQVIALVNFLPFQSDAVHALVTGASKTVVQTYIAKANYGSNTRSLYFEYLEPMNVRFMPC
jgi:hypothetical protein